MRPDALLILGVAGILGSVGATAPGAAMLVGLGFAFLVWRQRGWGCALTAVGFAGAVALRAERSLEDYARRRGEAIHAVSGTARCAGQGWVRESPVLAQDRLVLVVDTESLDCGGGKLTGLRARIYGGPPDVRRGDQVQLVAQLAPLRLFRNRALPDPTPRATRSGVVLTGGALAVEVTARSCGLGSWIDRARQHSRERINATFSPSAQALGRALVLGENDLDPADAEAFKASGLAHLLAVSGTHLVFAVLGIMAGIRAMLVRIEALAGRTDVERWIAGFGAGLALLYADFAGGSGSAWRAGWMMAFALGVRACGRRVSGLRCLGASLVIAALVDPLVAYDLSTLLSAAATAGLMVLGKPLARICEEIPWTLMRWAGKSVAVTLAALIPCIPLLAQISPTLTLAGIIANGFAGPLGEMAALPLCLAHSVLSPCPPLEAGAALAGSGALLAVGWMARVAAGATFLAIPVPPPSVAEWVAMAFLVGTLSSLQRRRRLWAVGYAVLLGGLEVKARAEGAPWGLLRVSVLDVDQGDSILVDLPDGSLFLVDGGGFVGSGLDPGRSVVLPVLRARRRSRIDVAVLTHPHPDHLLGLATAVKQMEVGEIWDNGQGEEGPGDPAYLSLLADAKARGIPVRRPPELCRGHWDRGETQVRVLGPCPKMVSGAEANRNSLVVSFGFRGRNALLVGDATIASEASLIAVDPAALRADFLKVGHHGSRTSSSLEFLKRVQAKWAAISCGVRNPHGHPHREALERLGSVASFVLRTDQLGGISWETDGEEQGIGSFLPPGAGMP